mmetsp:Transcript_14755/g.43033  ORF Transcript_14755/g.43033 Transcript_14755/m.43033 type:complete len:248 (+) Transcript_14755:26-769(+)
MHVPRPGGEKLRGSRPARRGGPRGFSRSGRVRVLRLCGHAALDAGHGDEEEDDVDHGHAHEDQKREQAARAARVPAPVERRVDVGRDPVLERAAGLVVDVGEERVGRREQPGRVGVREVERLPVQAEVQERQREVPPVHHDGDGLRLAGAGLEDQDPVQEEDHEGDDHHGGAEEPGHRGVPGRLVAPPVLGVGADRHEAGHVREEEIDKLDQGPDVSQLRPPVFELGVVDPVCHAPGDAATPDHEDE